MQLLHQHAIHVAAQHVDLLRAGVDFHPQPRGGLVHQVDGLVGQLPAGDVAIRQGGGSHQRGIGDAHLVVRLVAFPQPTQDGDGVLHGGFTDVDLLEAALQSGILLYPFPVLVERGGADHPQLTAGEHGFEHVARVHPAIPGGTGPDDGVQLVDEGDDLSLGFLDLAQDRFQALLEVAPVLGPGHHRGEVEGNQAAPLQGVGNVALHQAHGESLDDGGLADPGFADKYRVVLGSARKHLDDAADLLVTPDHGVELAGAGALGQVYGVLVEGRLAALGFRGCDALAAACLLEYLGQFLGSGPGTGQDGSRLGIDGGEGYQQVFGRDELVPELFGQGLRRGQYARQGTRDRRLGHGTAGAGRLLGDGLDGLGVNSCGVGTDCGQQVSDGVVGGEQEPVQQMHGLCGRVARGKSLPHRRGHGVAALGGQFLSVHQSSRERIMKLSLPRST